MFLGNFLSSVGSIDGTRINPTETRSFELSNAIYDELYLDTDTSMEYTIAIPQWGYSTVFDAKFKGNLLAGNVDFTLSSVSAILIKKRKKGTYKWTTIHSIPVTKVEDLVFALNDITTPSKSTYTYAAVPIIDGTEGTYQTTDIDIQFKGAFIIDKTHTYRLYLDFSRDSLSRAIPSSIIEPANSKYPHVVYTSKSNYDKVTVSGLFVNLESSTKTIDDNWGHRREVRDFLNNGLAKTIKFDNGEIWIGKIIDSIQESTNGYSENIKTSFTFVEIGDAESNEDLYYHGFSNYLEVKV